MASRNCCVLRKLPDKFQTRSTSLSTIERAPGMIKALAANEKLSFFSDLEESSERFDGNASVHARKLEDAGYVICEKSFKGRTPLTEYSITVDGRAALEQYLNHMEALIAAMRNV